MFFLTEKKVLSCAEDMTHEAQSKDNNSWSFSALPVVHILPCVSTGYFFPLVVQETFSSVLQGRQAGEGQSDLASADDLSSPHLGMSPEPQNITVLFTIVTTMGL